MSVQVPKGYKQTEVGVIPEDWSISPLGDLVLDTEYGSSAKSKPSGKTPVLRMGNLQDGAIDWSNLVFTDDEHEINKYNLEYGDILFNRTNTIDLVGKTSIYKGEVPAIFAGYLIRVKSDARKINSFYLNRALNAEFSKKYSLKVLSIAVGQANINAEKLKTYPIPLPPTLAEQDSIAEALSDADALIESLEQLIAKKRQIKQGAMQELLTGQRRLPGFSGEWELKKLKDFGSTYGGLTGKTKSDFGEGSSHYITFMNVMSNIVIDDEIFELVNVSENESQNNVMMGDLLFNGSSETPEELGFCSVVNKQVKNVYLNSFCFGFRFKEVNKSCGLYFAYFFRSKEGRELLKSLAQGATRYNLSKTSLLNLSFRIPSLDEQIAIADVLSELDAEVSMIQSRLSKARQIKQAMMQELLTGRIRLI